MIFVIRRALPSAATRSHFSQPELTQASRSYSPGVLTIILLTKTTAAQKEAAVSYHRVRGLHFLAVVLVRSTLS